MKNAILISWFFSLMFVGTVSATIIDVPFDQPTIQAGIDASSHGDTVRVESGTYVENIDFSGKNIVVGSWFLDAGDTSFISSTIIDGNGVDRVVNFTSGETNDAKITGFTIQNGLAQDGGGIYCNSSSPTISNNTISGNSADYRGGGILCWDNSNPTISNNTISGNSAAQYGGGIYCASSSPTISNNTISGNSGVHHGGGIRCVDNSNPAIINNTISGNSAGEGGGIYCSYSSPTISNNTISGNSAGNDGGGIWCDESSPTITNNTISENSADDYGGGIICGYSSPTLTNNTISGNSAGYGGGGIICGYSSPVITNTIFWGNSAPNGPEIYLFGPSSPVITYCDVQGGWAGEGNIDADPLFRDPENGDFHLQSITNPDCGGPGDSPCIDAGDPTIFDSMIDCDWGLGAERSDMGAYGGEGIPTNIEEKDIPAIPAEFILSQNYPNPFNATTTIQYNLPKATDVAIDIYDILGRKVETLIDKKEQAGYHQVIWKADKFSSGVYFYKLQAGDYIETKKMSLLK